MLTPVKRRPLSVTGCFVYILASKQGGSLHIGVAQDLIKKIHEHKSRTASSMTKGHNARSLVYYEETENMESALVREKVLKAMDRDWKLRMIKRANPNWEDLYNKLLNQ